MLHRGLPDLGVDMTDLKVGDIVLTPDDDLVTIVHLCHDGRWAVESPWVAGWARYRPDQLVRPDNGE